MTRRLLGPIGGPVVFFLVAALVFAGLGWVTYSALGVERAQREAAAQAKLGNNLRVALWQLDSRMLPALGVEDSRPYYHYAPPDPAGTPLFVATLPNWMRLHFQLDPANGWSSPLVLDENTAKLVREAWADVPPVNMSPERLAALNELKARFPARTTSERFAATDRSIPNDAYSLAAPIVAGDVQAANQPAPLIPPALDLQQQVAPQPLPDTNSYSKLPQGDTSPDVVKVLGLELCLRDDKASQVPQSQTVQLNSSNSPSQAIGPSQPPAPGGRGGVQLQNNSVRGGRLNQQKDAADSEKQLADWMSRAGLIDRAIREAKNAGQYQMPRGQYGNSQQNYLPNDPRNAPNVLSKFKETPYDGKSGLPSTAPVSGGTGGGSSPSAIPGGAPFGAPKGLVEGRPVGPPGLPTDGWWKETSRTVARMELARSKAIDELRKDARFRRPSGEDKAETLLVARDRFLFALELSEWFARPNGTRARMTTFDDATKKLADDEIAHDKASETPKAALQPPTPTTAPTPPTSTPPPGAGFGPPAMPGAEPLPMPPPTPAAIHLGSMRPQWLTAPDGSEMLVLVRAAKVDGKTVYQGVAVDWPRLEAELKSVVAETFPNARLVPVKDATQVLPDRAMTALPVQLDPGMEPEPAPAGWTTLRLGLGLAWVAAIIAVAAVGFAGWSLIDLAERRIRFVSAVTHELRTPLTSFRLYLDLLVSGMIQDEEKRREYLGTLAMESDRLHRLIDNVLDFAKLEKRKANGDIQPVVVNDLLDGLRQTWADRVLPDGKELVVISLLPAERTVSTDAAMIQQIVGNLIDNARKYTRDAEDHRIWLWARPGSGNGVVLEVEDRGAGVPAAERKSIFKPFRRGNQADSKAGGAGLGLSLAKSWAEVLGASLTYRPADGGVGACFRLELSG